MEVGFHVVRERSVIWVSGAVSDNRPHTHHALQVTWAAPGAGDARLELGAASIAGPCVAVDGGVEHALELPRGLIALIDAESPLAQGIRARFPRGEGFAALEGAAWSGRREDAGRLLAEVGGAVEGAPLDARVRAVLQWLDTMEEAGAWDEVSLEGALRQAHLSASRFRHLFTAGVGTPWRTYLVWRRALVAMTLAADGATLTEAAHAAGYADSAHLSRQFVSLFGVTPAAVVRNSHFVQS